MTSGFDLSQKRRRSLEVDPKKGLTHPDGGVSANMFPGDPLRQLGDGSQEGAEALAIFQQLIFDEWMSGTLDTLLVRIKVGERNCFGLIEGARCETQQVPVSQNMQQW